MQTDPPNRLESVVSRLLGEGPDNRWRLAVDANLGEESTTFVLTFLHEGAVDVPEGEAALDQDAIRNQLRAVHARLAARTRENLERLAQFKARESALLLQTLMPDFAASPKAGQRQHAGSAPSGSFNLRSVDCWLGDDGTAVMLAFVRDGAAATPELESGLTVEALREQQRVVQARILDRIRDELDELAMLRTIERPIINRRLDLVEEAVRRG